MDAQRRLRHHAHGRAFFLAVLLLGTISVGAAENLTLIDEKSPDFLLGKATRRGLLIRSADNPDMSLSLGARMQGTVEARQSGGAWLSDVYGRRIRFELTANFSKRIAYVMDIRNDQANRGDGGEMNFVVGNAFIQVRELMGLPCLNFQGFRGKVDVSRVTTVSSGQQLYYDRPYVSLFAQQFVSHNRRAANLQLFGSYEGKVRYQVAVGDGVAGTVFQDARGRTASSVTRQDPMLGGKVILSPIPGWEEKERTSTYFGRGQFVSVGAGYYFVNAIGFRPTAAGAEQRVNRGLFNAEATVLYGPLFIQAEYLSFTGVTEDFSAATIRTGSSSGWYVNGEYVLPELGYLAPMIRYEKWNRFRQATGYSLESAVVGLNWYLMGNSLRAGLMVERNWHGPRVGGGTETIVRAISQLHF